MISPFEAAAQLLATRMVDSLAWGTVAVVFAVIVLRITRQGAAARFAVLLSALGAIGLVPVVTSVWRPIGFISSSTVGRAAITFPDRWAVYFCAVWAAIAGLFAVGVVRAVWHLHVLRRGCEAMDPDTLDPLLRETLLRHGSNRRVRLCTSEQMNVPTALGLLKPVVVLPRWVLNELSAKEINQILLHELAHLRRWDDWTNLLQQAMKAVFFFHPAVWWIEKKVALEREMACDDMVVAETESPRAYAECLARLAEKSFLQRSVVLAQAALGKLRHTSLRVAQILNGNAGRTRSWKPAVSLVGAFAIVCGIWSAKVPKLIAFRDSASASGTQSLNSATFAQVQRVDASITQPVPVTPAKFIPSRQMNRRMPLNTRPVIARRATSKPKVANVVHLTAAKPAILPFTETVFFVIEGSDGSAPELRVYQIQMFRLTLLQQSTEPASTTPQKET
jgi:beta-lactamase regulating signal transducer with metallopeptidase domain